MKIKPIIRLLDILLNYRMKNLKQTTQKHTGSETDKIRDHAKRMELKLSDHNFYGKERITILTFLQFFVSDFDKL